MNVPGWLAGMTNAAKFADPLKNGGAPTMGDALQGIGSSMKNHYLYGQGSAPAIPGQAPQPAAAPAPAPAPIPMAAFAQPQAPAPAGMPWGTFPPQAPGPVGAASNGGASSIPLAEILQLLR